MISKVVKEIRHRLNPLAPWISMPDYRTTARMARFEPGSVGLLGHRCRFGDYYGFLHSMREIFGEQVYRFASEKSSPLIIDAGANIGLSILYFKREFPDARIIAYEPDPEIFRMLEQNVAHLRDVQLHRAAAWSANTELTFYSEGSLAGSTEVDTAGAGLAVQVPALDVRTALREDEVDFLKIDIEGGENSLLFDIEPELANVRNLFFEYHSIVGRKQQLGDMLNMVASKGFRFVIGGAHGPPFPFVERPSSGFDTQINVSCFRESESR